MSDSTRPKKIENNSWHLDKNSVVVMDEAGMTGLNDMLEIIRYVEAKGAKLVLVGDDKQLQPIDKGAPFRAIIEATQNFRILDEVVRQVNGQDRQATKEFALGNTEKALAHYEQKGCLFHEKTDELAQETLIQNWATELESSAVSEQIILAHRRVDVDALNQKARALLMTNGALHGESITLQTSNGAMEVRLGERVLFSKNDAKTCVKNGEFATVTKIKDGYVSFISDGETTENTIRADQIKDVHYGYATTVHKSQGITRKNVFVGFVAARSSPLSTGGSRQFLNSPAYQG